MTKPPPTATQIARTERMRVAAETGAAALADVRAKDVAVRKNMQRLREMRLAKEASEAASVQEAPAVKKRTTKKTIRVPA